MQKTGQFGAKPDPGQNLSVKICIRKIQRKCTLKIGMHFLKNQISGHENWQKSRQDGIFTGAKN